MELWCSRKLEGAPSHPHNFGIVEHFVIHKLTRIAISMTILSLAGPECQELLQKFSSVDQKMKMGRNENFEELKQTHPVRRAPLRQRGLFQTSQQGIWKSH